MSLIVAIDGWIAEGAVMTRGEPVPADVLKVIGDPQPFIDAGYIYEEGATAQPVVSPLDGKPLSDASLPETDSPPAT